MPHPIIDQFQQQYGTRPEAAARAPGRLEILGNHTDYNEGVVLSVAVDREMRFAASVVPGTECEVHDVRSGDRRLFHTDAIAAPVPHDWSNYIKGMVVELQKRGIMVPAFKAVLQSTVPLSAGMSSSAAFEMAVALVLGRLAKVELPWLEWARIGQACENNYVGARTGLLDQFSSLRGKKGHFVFSDFRSLEVETIAIPAGTALVVANSMVKHHLTNEYNDRRASCEQAVQGLRTRFPEIRALRDVSPAQLAEGRTDLDVLSYRRALHVVGENARVFAGIAALQKNELRTFGQLMIQSHESSRVNFENSCPELDALVEIGHALPGVLGGRLSGGGFGGITVHMVLANEADVFAHRLATGCESRVARKPETMICHAADGASLLELGYYV